MSDKIHFGTDGWRGLIDVEVTNKTIAKVAQAFADYLIIHSSEKDVLKVAIGHDGRTHSKPWAILFARVLSGNNIVVYLSDRIGPTPVLSYYVKANNLNAGVMITASHNPYDYNGLKFKSSFGGPFFAEQTLEIESLIGKELIQANDEKIYQTDMRSSYYKHIEKFIDFETIKKAGLNILIDSMAGAGQQVLETLFMKHDIQSKTIFKIAEKDFAGRLAEPIERNLLPMREELLRESYSIGLATDGDADRLGVMMENGEWLSSQETILLLADYVVNQKNIKGNLAKTSSVTDKVKELFEKDGRKVFDVQVGFKYICEKMLEEDIAFGCEESGGYGFKDHIPDRDGLLSALLLIEMLAKSGLSKLSEYASVKRKEFGQIFFNRLDYKYEKEDMTERIPEFFKNPPLKIGEYQVLSFKEFYSSRGAVNGLKFTLDGNTRWLLIRTSETEPLIRIYAEGQNESEVESILKAGQNLFS